MPRRTSEDYHALAAERGFTWLGPEVPYTRTKTEWLCPQGHRWLTDYHGIQRGYGCPQCSPQRRRKTPEVYHLLAAERGITWLGPEVQNTSIKTEWQCPLGHRWFTTGNNIKQGTNCPECDLQRKIERNASKRRTPEDYHTLAAERGITWLGPEVRNKDTKTEWQCSRGHRWFATRGSIQAAGGCPKCHTINLSASKRLTTDDYHHMAELNNLTWLGPEALNNRTKTFWRCPEGHVFKTNYQVVKVSQGCPECQGFFNGYKTSSQQRYLCDLLEGELNYIVGNFCLDIALHIDGTFINVEYDGFHWHKDKQQQDRRRDTSLLKQGWHILRIKSRELLPDIMDVYKAIGRLIEGENYIEIVLSDWGEE